jgi:HD-GYP domain-containing protein (c-di-GMP phosphodiesterase class II)
VLHHHERWDGRGYPFQLAASEIPLLARIISVADSYDAMASDRPYRPGMPEEKVRAIFEDGAGSQWDTRVVEAFFGIQDEIRAIAQTEREQLNLSGPQLLTAAAPAEPDVVLPEPIASPAVPVG